MAFPSLIWDIEDVKKQGEQQANEATAVRMLKAGKLVIEEIANYSSLPLAMIQKLAQAVALGTM